MSQEDIPMPWLESMPEGRATTLDYEEVPPIEFLRRRVESQPDKPFMILDKGVTITFGEAYKTISQIAANLQKMGVEKGDRVALMLNNIPPYIFTHYACLAIGATVVQVNPLYTEPELKHIVTDSGAKALVTLTMFQEKSNNVLQSTDLEFVIYTKVQNYLSGLVRFLGKILKGRIAPLFDPKDDAYEMDKYDVANTYDFEDFTKGDGRFSEPDLDIKEDVAILQYTGGTTGFPKGAMLTHRNLSINAQQCRAVLYMVEDNVGAVLTVLPLFHVFGMTVCMNLSIQMGIPMILNIKNPPSFDDILGWIEKYNITFLPGVPRIFIEINKHPKAAKTDFSSLIAAISGGAPLPLEVAKEFKRVANADLVEGYGLSETSPITHVNPIGLPPRENSIGLPAPDTMVKIVDLEDPTKTLGIDEVGEITIKGPQVFKGYWNMPEETEMVLSDDGWFRTGDIGYLDEEGYFYIVDRKKDMIIVSGYNVYPREVEDVLFEHPKVQEAAVAGKQDEKRGEIVAAWIVLKEGQTATKEEIIDYCRDNLAAYKVPKEVTFRDELPTSMVGKVLRRKLTDDEEASE